MVNKFHRNPRSINEMRVAADPEMAQFIRAKRRPHNLPNSWDDIPRSQNKYKPWRVREISRDSIRYW